MAGYLPADFADRLRRAGLEVRELPGWQRRGAATLRPRVAVVHDDIIWGCPTSPPGVIPNGRPAPPPPLPGPLYNGWTACTGVVWVIAAGVSNNAGRGSWAGFTGNSATVGWCRSHHPDGGAHGGTDAQNDATAVVCAVLADLYGIPVANVIGHKEWTSRKPDPWNLDMDGFRRQVAAGGQGEDELMGLADDILANQWREAIATAKARDAAANQEWTTRRIMADLLEAVLVATGADRSRLAPETVAYLAATGNDAKPPEPVHERAVIAHARAAGIDVEALAA